MCVCVWTCASWVNLYNLYEGVYDYVNHGWPKLTYEKGKIIAQCIDDDYDYVVIVVCCWLLLLLLLLLVLLLNSRLWIQVRLKKKYNANPLRWVVLWRWVLAGRILLRWVLAWWVLAWWVLAWWVLAGWILSVACGRKKNQDAHKNLENFCKFMKNT